MHCGAATLSFIGSHYVLWGAAESCATSSGEIWFYLSGPLLGLVSNQSDRSLKLSQPYWAPADLFHTEQHFFPLHFCHFQSSPHLFQLFRGIL